MTKVIEAIYTKGVLRPLEELALPEDQRVRLIVEAIEDAAPQDRAAAFRRLVAGIEAMDFFSCGPVPTREQLHDRL